MSFPQDDGSRSPSASGSEPLVPFPIPGPSELQRRVMAMPSSLGSFLIPVRSLSHLHPRAVVQPAPQENVEEMPPPALPDTRPKPSLVVVLKVPNLTRVVGKPRSSAFIDTPPYSRRPSIASSVIAGEQNAPSGNGLRRPCAGASKLAISTGVTTGNVQGMLNTPTPTPMNAKFPSTRASQGGRAAASITTSQAGQPVVSTTASQAGQVAPLATASQVGQAVASTTTSQRGMSVPEEARAPGIPWFVSRVPEFEMIRPKNSMGKYASKKEMEHARQAKTSLVVKLKVPSLYSIKRGYAVIDGWWMRAETAVKQGHLVKRRYVFDYEGPNVGHIKPQYLHQPTVERFRQRELAEREMDTRKKSLVVVLKVPNLWRVVDGGNRVALKNDAPKEITAQPDEKMDDPSDNGPKLPIKLNDGNAVDEEAPSGTNLDHQPDTSTPTNPTLLELVDNHLPGEFGRGTLLFFSKSGVIEPPEVPPTDPREILALETVRQFENTPQDHNVFTHPIPCMVCEETNGHKYDCAIGNMDFNDNPTAEELEAYTLLAEPIEEDTSEDQMMRALGIREIPIEAREAGWDDLMAQLGPDPDFPNLEGLGRVLAEAFRGLGMNAQPITRDNIPRGLMEFNGLDDADTRALLVVDESGSSDDSGVDGLDLRGGLPSWNGGWNTGQ